MGIHLMFAERHLLPPSQHPASVMAAAVQIIAEQAVRFGENLREQSEASLTPAEALLIFAAHLAVLARDVERHGMMFALEMTRLGVLAGEQDAEA